MPIRDVEDAVSYCGAKYITRFFVSAPVSFRRSRVPPPYWVFVGWPHTIKCSVGNGLDRSGAL